MRDLAVTLEVKLAREQQQELKVRRVKLRRELFERQDETEAQRNTLRN